MKRSLVTGAEVPPGVVTVMSTVPAGPEGEVTAQLVIELQLTVGADVVPNLAVVEVDPVTNQVAELVRGTGGRGAARGGDGDVGDAR